MKETEEKEKFKEECINRFKYFNEAEEVIRQNETNGKLADRDLMRTVWASQVEMGQSGRAADFVSLI